VEFKNVLSQIILINHDQPTGHTHKLFLYNFHSLPGASTTTLSWSLYNYLLLEFLYLHFSVVSTIKFIQSNFYNLFSPVTFANTFHPEFLLKFLQDFQLVLPFTWSLTFICLHEFHKKILLELQH